MIESYPVNVHGSCGSIEFHLNPGDSIAQCLEKSSQIARKLGLSWVWFKHNGIHFAAYPNGEGLERWDEFGKIIYWKACPGLSPRWERRTQD